jgi:hypothetical protein
MGVWEGFGAEFIGRAYAMMMGTKAQGLFGRGVI